MKLEIGSPLTVHHHSKNHGRHGLRFRHGFRRSGAQTKASETLSTSTLMKNARFGIPIAILGGILAFMTYSNKRMRAKMVSNLLTDIIVVGTAMFLIGTWLSVITHIK